MGFAPGVGGPGGGPGGGGMYSRPPSRPPSGFGGARFNSTPSHGGGGGGGGVSMAAAAERAAATRSASGIPRLPPLARGMSVSVGAMPQVSTFISVLSILCLGTFSPRCPTLGRRGSRRWRGWSLVTRSENSPKCNCLSK